MVAGERPVAGLRARGDGLGPGHGPARALLVDHQLQRLADGVRRHRPGSGQDGSGRQAYVLAAYRRPAEQEQQQAQGDQGELGDRFQEASQRGGRVRDPRSQRPVQGDGGALGDLGRFGPAEPTR
ncbi:hypothetical protein ACH4A6_02890 [Streptomyces atroolivaceus]|uniref:hypothetical protein n=1 Tax=Streptomyces atroolivaceus TaxID=66869 RepID=UPI0037A33C22